MAFILENVRAQVHFLKQNNKYVSNNRCTINVDTN